MKILLLSLMAVTVVSAAAWWRNPDPLQPDLTAFEDGGRSIVWEASRNGDIPPSVEIHLEIASRFLPAAGGLALVALCAGLYFRERRRYASPTLAWLAKRTAAGGIVLLALFVVAPLGWTMWFPYLAAITMSVGIAVYTANLPQRL